MMQNARKVIEELREAVAAEAAAKKKARMAIIERGRDMMLAAQAAIHQHRGTKPCVHKK